jgi:hypothetical protein
VTEVQAVDPAKARRFTWGVLLFLGALQAWASRFSATPDGMSYVDLSDGVVSGHLGRLVNGYWSPAYPVLIGLTRLILRPSAYWEYATVHLVNWLLFAASLVAFEYFLRSLEPVLAGLGRHSLQTTSGKLVAYATFGVLSLVMTPLTLPTPDLLVTAWTFLTFGALLRLQENSADRTAAIMLGISLGFGALTKSFYFPWSVVAFVCAGISLRRRGARALLFSIAIWLVIVTPWCVALSRHEGRLTFGDTGRLTYIWNVNLVESPTLKIMPHASTLPSLEPVLAGVAVLRNADGSNPVWFDPVRWYADLHPRWDPAAQLHLFSGLITYFFSTLAPVLLLVWCFFALARRDERRQWGRKTWIVFIPALAAVGAYSLVLMTARYVAPFMVVLTVVTCFGLRWPSRIPPARMAIGIGVPLLILMARADTGLTFTWMNCVVAGVLIAWAFRRRGNAAMLIAGVLGGLAVRVLQPTGLETIPILTGALIVAVYFIAARRSFLSHEPRAFSRAMRSGLVGGNIVFVLILCGMKYYGSIQPAPSYEGEPNVLALQARAMGQAGLEPGDKVAVIGSPFEAYWVRTARMQIVGVVPPWQVGGFMKLDRGPREAVERAFADAGAKAIVAQAAQPPVSGDTAWHPYDYIGWVKRLR